MIDATEFFRALSDETRLRCLLLLAAEGELCVCELTQALDQIQPKVSRHLATLRTANLVTDRKRGQWVYYALNRDLPAWVFAVLDETARGVAGTEPFAGDRLRLGAMGNRPARCGEVFNVLFLCTGNSARSIMAEALVRQWGAGRFRAFSAGSRPAGAIHPLTLKLLASLDVPTEGLRSKSWDEFAGPDAPPLDFVFTVCDAAAGEVCPAWPGQPLTAHWGVPDPVAVEGDEVARMHAFREAFRQLDRRIRIFTSLRLEGLSRLALQHRLDDIGKTFPETIE